MDKYDYSEGGRNEGKRRGRSRGLITAIVVISMVLSGVTLAALNFYGNSVYYKNQLENQYQRAFYDLSGNMTDLEVKLSKLMVSYSTAQIQKNLNEVAIQTESTQINLSQLPATQEAVNKTMKYVNQLGDYSSYLSNKLSTGGKLSEDDYKTLESLYNINRELVTQLSALASRIQQESVKLVNTKTGSDEANPLNNGFSSMQDSSIDYPSMIYDGPFSESSQSTVVKGLAGEEVTKEKAEENLNNYFKDFAIAETVYENETNGKISTYNFNVKLSSGQSMYVQMSKIGGIPVSMNNKRGLDNFNLTVEDCIKKAEEFAGTLNFDSLKSVWASDYNGNVYVNLAPVKDGIIYYPDLVKVIVARDNGEIIGFDAASYLTNHTNRTLGAATLKEVEAQRYVSGNISIVSRKKALIPMDGAREMLAYEYAGEWNGTKYFVYIDASDGTELKVMRVIDSQEGTFVV